MARLFRNIKRSVIIFLLAAVLILAGGCVSRIERDRDEDEDEKQSSIADLLEELQNPFESEDEDIDEGSDENNEDVADEEEDTDEEIDTNDDQNVFNSSSSYFNVDQIDGSYNASEDIAITWQKNGLIRSEVKVFMDTVYWTPDYACETLETRSDLDEDGEDEHLAIENDTDSGAITFNIKMGGKTVNLLDLVSEEFYEVAMMLADENNYFVAGTALNAACIDIDKDGRKEIFVAVGNDNGILAVSILKYVGGNNLYKEAGGIKGTKELRYIILTETGTIFTELYFTNAASFDPMPVNYAEFLYKKGELNIIRYRDE